MNEIKIDAFGSYKIRFVCDLKLIHAQKPNRKLRKLEIQNNPPICLSDAN